MRANMVALGVGVAAVCTVPLAITVTADASADVLLSRRHAVVASSAQDSARAGAMAVDGDTTTRWTSGADPGSQWLRLDLGRAQAVTRVRLIWDAPHARTYRLQLSANGVTWTDLHRRTGGDGGIDDVKRLSGSGRYLRLLATQRAQASGFSLRELQVFGPGPATAATPVTTSASVPAAAAGLATSRKKELALQLVSSAENSTLDWREEFDYIEDIGDGRGYTAGIVGFCSGTSDMLALVTEYTRRSPRNKLARYLPALRAVDGSASHRGLDPGFTAAWKAAAADPVFRKTQEDERDRMYFDPAVTLATADGLRALGQFAYYDAAVMHGMSGLREIRAAALQAAKTPKLGGDETVFLERFLDARVREMRTEEAHSDVSRVETAQRTFLRAGNLDLNTPLTWRVYGDRFAA
ncbi:chitosanase [Couchioplanes caeruleus]|uniref:Chemotaxis protein n=2 Tax=Couchioplanes caeruleus TaxID=56438 RepID=A0A1K0GF53_9ACTN|nr:chitosanase [Couchioplanes caeruleus]OJF10798.1 chemotaxis protein [Couchioplanes caeruleus subsp. caeruleus]ROP32186.1 chitosanase [Couchioplanes caeruleus]